MINISLQCLLTMANAYILFNFHTKLYVATYILADSYTQCFLRQAKKA